MGNLVQWVIDNRQWIFSGIGVTAVVTIGAIIFKRRRKSKIISSKTTGASYVAEKITVNNSTGLTYVDVKEIAKSIFLENFPKLQEVARIEAEKNRDLFISELDKKIQEKLTQEEIDKFNKPDIQYILSDAITTAARRDNEETRKILSNLIVDRVKNDGIEFKELVYNEAIRTIPQLTKNHLDILAFTFITKYTLQLNINTLCDLVNRMNNWIPLTNFSDSSAQFQHLEYANCATNTVFGTDLQISLRKNYTNIFLINSAPHINKLEYNKWRIPDEIKSQLFTPDTTEENYYLIQNTLAKFDEKYNELMHENIKSYMSPYTDLLVCIKNDKEISELVSNELSCNSVIFDKYNKTGVQNLNLTSVGIVIGASHYESVTGDKINIDLWIN